MAARPQKSTGSVRPGAGTRLLVNVTGAGLWVSGGVWLIYRHFLRSDGEFGPEPHALEPWWLMLHAAFAFLALAVVGLMWGAHMTAAWKSGRRRWRGSVLFAWLATLIVTGYLLYYAGDDGAWGALSPAHWIAGLALPLAYAVHAWLKRGPDR